MLCEGLYTDQRNTAKMIGIIFLLLATSITNLNSEYIPPGPAYPCPKESDRQLMYPCVCEKGTDAGLHILCQNTGLAVLSVGLGNIAGMGLPIERLSLKECKISHLFGPIFYRSTIRVMHIEDTPIKSIDMYAFAGVNRTLQEVYMVNTKINEFPKEAFQILGNLSVLSINGHMMTKLGKDIFAGSEAAGKLERLHLSNGLISDVPVEAFQTLKKLKTLDLHGNRLATLKRNQFRGLRDTEVLDLSYNNITKLDGSHIGDLTKLGWCNASNNLIGEIPRGMFARNTVLKVVHLDNNRIKKLDTNSFRGMRFLRRLYLQNNQISDVGRGTFSAVTRIGTVDLSRNRIKKVDYQMFQAVKYAELINLAENEITIVENQAFTDLYQATVNISHNHIATIEAGAFQNCNNMTLLELGHNHLENITSKAFDENTYAFEFRLTHNRFVDFAQIPIQNMSGIRILNVSHNRIRTIPKLAFPKLYELHTVDISHNDLSEISNAVFQNLFSLRYLDLSHNSMEVIKPATFGSVPTVLELNLSHNKLRDVSKGSLAKLASCRVIDVSYNQLDRIFQIPISLGELNFAHNSLQEVRISTWPAMNALLRLNLSNNMLGDNLDSNSFSGLLTVQSLDLSGNGLTKPPWEALNTFTSLQYLYMQYNNLSTLGKSAFGNLPTMFKLDLSANQLSSIGQHSFTGMQQLLDLTLSANNLVKIPNEAFKGLVALRNLDLSHNQLERIDNKTNGLLDDCLSLETVNLSHNKFGYITKKTFPSNPWIPYQLREVDLSHNELPVLTMDLTAGTKKVNKLNLTGNSIIDIRSNVLGNLTSLEVLDLSNNNLKDLQSSISDIKLQFPENITELYLQNNELGTLPTENLVKAGRLKMLDVRHNRLTSFLPELVGKIKDNGLNVYFEGNPLRCDCFTRPLKHYLSRLPPSVLKNYDSYKNLTCYEPISLENENFLTVDEDRLLCAGNIDSDKKILEYGNTEGGASYEFSTEPDLAFRDVQYSQSSIYVHWYIVSAEDVADVIVYIKDDKSNLHYSNQVAYNLRSLTITIEDALKETLKSGGPLEICIQAKSSNDSPRKWHASQCQAVPRDFDNWHQKLTVDKRRLTKKKVRYSWFSSNSVLGLVSDSILITLCIFLGVCLKITDLA